MEWWNLPGPARFISDLLASLLQRGIALAECPRPFPEGLLDAIGVAADHDFALSAIRIRATDFAKDASIVHSLARGHGSSGISIGSIAEFLAYPEFSSSIFVVEGFDSSAISQWSALIRAVLYERMRIGHDGGPYLLVLPPPGLSDDDKLRLSADLPRQQLIGAVTSVDTYAWAGAIGLMHSGSLIETVAVGTVLEIAAWSRDILEASKAWSENDKLLPHDRIADIARSRTWPFPSWENGLVDLWGAAPVPQIAAALAHGYHREVPRRIWAAQMKSILPCLDIVRRGVIAKHQQSLSRLVSIERPYRRMFGSSVRETVDPWELEFYDLETLLPGLLSESDRAGLKALRGARNNLAHGHLLDPSRLRDIDIWWQQLSERFPPVVPGWRWPRTGQKLVLTIGPSLGGKTTWATAQGLPIVSSSAMGNSASQRVRQELDTKVQQLLESGASVIFDDGHLNSLHRQVTVALVPPDIQVEYVILDRTIEDKTQGLDPQREAIVRRHHDKFQSDLDGHLSGDGLSNVQVRDLRLGR